MSLLHVDFHTLAEARQQETDSAKFVSVSGTCSLLVLVDAACNGAAGVVNRTFSTSSAAAAACNVNLCVPAVIKLHVAMSCASLLA